MKKEPPKAGSTDADSPAKAQASTASNRPAKAAEAADSDKTSTNKQAKAPQATDSDKPAKAAKQQGKKPGAANAPTSSKQAKAAKKTAKPVSARPNKQGKASAKAKTAASAAASGNSDKPAKAAKSRKPSNPKKPGEMAAAQRAKATKQADSPAKASGSAKSPRSIKNANRKAKPNKPKPNKASKAVKNGAKPKGTKNPAGVVQDKKKPTLALPPAKTNVFKQLAAPAATAVKRIAGPASDAVKRLAAPVADAVAHTVAPSTDEPSKNADAVDKNDAKSAAPSPKKDDAKPQKAEPKAKKADQSAKKGSDSAAKQTAQPKKSQAKAAPQKNAAPKTASAQKKSKTGVHTPAHSNIDPTSFKGRMMQAKSWLTQNIRTPKVIIPAVLLVIYIIGAVVFSSLFLPGTVINGDDVSWRTVSATLKRVNGVEGNGYSIDVSGNDINLSLTAPDISFEIDEQTYRQSAAQHLAGWTWPVSIFLPRNFDVTEGTSFDQDKVTEVVTAAVNKANKNKTLPVDATIKYDSSQDSFVAVQEKKGTALSLERTVDAVNRGIGTLQNSVQLGEAELEQPAIVASNSAMEQAISKANALAQNEIQLTVQGKKAAAIDSEHIQSWLTIDDSYNVIADPDSVTEWARGELSAEVDTVATARTYTRPVDSKRIEVYGGGTYGWSADGSKLAELVCDSIANSSTENIEIPMLQKGEVYVHGKQDWGPRYVDVDLTEQYVRFFDENSNIIMESSCVSGNLSENNDTITGVFALEDKQSPATLVGLDENGDGEPDYENEVQYWMSFCGGYGLHDALWRSYFGDDVYQYDGSHGCVNLPYYSAELLYEQIKVGDVVVVHF